MILTEPTCQEKITEEFLTGKIPGKVIAIKVIRCLKMFSGQFCKCSFMICPFIWKI